METIIGAIILFGFGGVIFGLSMLLRNEAVYRFRRSVANRFVFDNPEWPQRLAWWERQPDYDEMVWKFWRPLPSFLTGKFADQARAAISDDTTP